MFLPSGIISSVLAMTQFREQFNLRTDIEGAIVSTFAGTFDHRPINPSEKFDVTLSSTPGGCFIGAAASGWANDKFGRKLTIQVRSVYLLLPTLL